MFYLVRHDTRYKYEEDIRENVMELRLEPRSDGLQRCLSFLLRVDPTPRVFQYRDARGNTVHHFDIAPSHRNLSIYAESLVETRPPKSPPSGEGVTWEEIDNPSEDGQRVEMMTPSSFCRTSQELQEFCRATGVERQHFRGPFELVVGASNSIFENLSYSPEATRVDSSIDVALQRKSGVCQDFAHILISILRENRIPARYVSGYLFHREVSEFHIAADATHAWVEAWLPQLGWVGFDPTSNLLCGERHIRTAIGRDYHDVPPTKGIYKGGRGGQMLVGVSVELWGSGLSHGRELVPVLVQSQSERAAAEIAGAGEQQ